MPKCYSGSISTSRLLPTRKAAVEKGLILWGPNMTIQQIQPQPMSPERCKLNPLSAIS